MFKAELVFGVIPKVTPVFNEPLKPSCEFLCKIILMIPLIPSGLYFAEGFVINSICLIEAEGICCNNCSTETFEGFPSISTRTLLFPLMLISFV